VEIISLRVGFHGWIVCHFLCYDTGSISCFSELVLSFDVFFKLLWSRMRFVVEDITNGGDLPDCLGDFCSGSAFSAPVISVFMSVVLRGAKKLWVNTAFEGSFDSCECCDWFSRLFGCLWGIIGDTPLVSLYLPEVIILGRSFHWGFVHYTIIACLCTQLKDITWPQPRLYTQQQKNCWKWCFLCDPPQQLCHTTTK
jgi:hypothetical protein